MHDWKVLAAAAVALAGCAPTGAADDDDATEDVIPEGACFADELESGVPLNDDIDALVERWDVNTDMARVLFVGEPL